MLGVAEFLLSTEITAGVTMNFLPWPQPESHLAEPLFRKDYFSAQRDDWDLDRRINVKKKTKEKSDV